MLGFLVKYTKGYQTPALKQLKTLISKLHLATQNFREIVDTQPSCWYHGKKREIVCTMYVQKSKKIGEIGCTKKEEKY